MPPLSSFVDRPSEAGDKCVRPCLEQAEAIVPQPSKLTRAYLGATAGMRLIKYII